MARGWDKRGLCAYNLASKIFRYIQPCIRSENTEAAAAGTLLLKGIRIIAYQFDPFCMPGKYFRWESYSPKRLCCLLIITNSIWGYKNNKTPAFRMPMDQDTTASRSSLQFSVRYNKIKLFSDFMCMMPVFLYLVSVCRVLLHNSSLDCVFRQAAVECSHFHWNGGCRSVLLLQ